MFKTLFNAFKVKDIRNKLLIVLALILVYRVGCAIVCPGLDIGTLIEEETTGTTFFSLMNMLSGNALANGSILALGVSPYITASIVIQLLTVAIPALERLAKQGEDGKKKMQFYTRITALVLAIAQAVGIVVSFRDNLSLRVGEIAFPTWLVGIGVVLLLTAGAMFTVWIGEKITSLGVCGSGMSILIFVGILASSAQGISDAIKQAIDDPNNIWMIIIYIVAVILIFGLIVFMDNSERRVPVSYAKQIKGRRMYGGQDTYIPIKLNSSGVMPIIFATSLLTLPQLVMSIFWPDSSALAWYNEYLGTSSWVYIVILALLIFAFAFFYSMITLSLIHI